MARVPTILSSGNVRTGPVAAQRTAFAGPGAAPHISFTGAEAQAAAGRSVAGGLMDIATAANRQIQLNTQEEKERAAKLKERENYNNHIWSESQYTAAQRQWLQWTDDVQKSESEAVVEKFNTDFSAYQEEALKNAPNEDARNRLKLKLDDLGTRVFDSALKIEANNRAKNTVNTFTRMLTDTTDVVVRDPILAAFPINDLRQNLNLAREQKRISDEVYQRLNEQVNNLVVIQAEAAATKDPAFARVVLEHAEGVDWARRKAALNVIERAEQTNDALFRYEQQELFKSHIDSVMSTGEGVSSFNPNTYAAAFPKEQRAAVLAELKDKVEMAKTVFVGKNSMQGKSPGQLNEVLSQYRPEAGDPKYNDKLAVYQKLSEFADHQSKLFNKDPFSYSRQDPVVDAAWDMVEDLPEGTRPEVARQLMQQALEASISYQQKTGIPEGRLSVMSTTAASQFAQKINQGSTQQVQDSFTQLQATYGKYYPMAFRDLVRLPEGQRIDAASQIVALHMGKPFLTDFIAAVRTPDSDIKLDSKDTQVLRDKLTTNPEFMSFKGAMLSANSGAVSMVNDFNHAIEKYARSILFRGKAKNPTDAVKQATDLVIGSAYGFTSVDGTPIAVMRKQNGVEFTDSDVATIGSALTAFQRTIEPSKIDLAVFRFPTNISEEMRTTSVANTIKNDAFWVTNPQNDGVILYMNGDQGTTTPVKWKDGRQVEAKFQTALSYGKNRANIKAAEAGKWQQMPLTGFYPSLLP